MTLADDDPTSEEEALDFDGTATDQLDGSYRLRVAHASENANGAVGVDDRGQAQWKWITELSGSPPPDSTGTFDQIKALDNPALSLEEESTAKRSSASKEGYDPYSTAVFDKRKRP